MNFKKFFTSLAVAAGVIATLTTAPAKAQAQSADVDLGQVPSVHLLAAEQTAVVEQAQPATTEQPAQVADTLPPGYRVVRLQAGGYAVLPPTKAAPEIEQATVKPKPKKWAMESWVTSEMKPDSSVIYGGTKVSYLPTQSALSIEKTDEELLRITAEQQINQVKISASWDDARTKLEVRHTWEF